MVEPGPAFIGSFGSGRKRPPGPVVRLMTTSVPLERMQSAASAYSAPSMLGSVVLGSRTWIWTIAAPALAASIAEAAICSGVTGTAGFFPAASAAPGRAHEIMTLRCPAALPFFLVVFPGGREQPTAARRNGIWDRAADRPCAPCLALCAALSLEPVPGTNPS